MPCSKQGDCSFTDGCIPQFCIPVSDCVSVWGIIPYLSSCLFGTCDLARKPGYRVFPCIVWVDETSYVDLSRAVCVPVKASCHGEPALCINNLCTSGDALHNLSVSYADVHGLAVNSLCRVTDAGVFNQDFRHLIHLSSFPLLLQSGLLRSLRRS